MRDEQVQRGTSLLEKNFCHVKKQIPYPLPIKVDWIPLISSWDSCPVGFAAVPVLHLEYILFMTLIIITIWNSKFGSGVYIEFSLGEITFWVCDPLCSRKTVEFPHPQTVNPASFSLVKLDSITSNLQKTFLYYYWKM